MLRESTRDDWELWSLPKLGFLDEYESNCVMQYDIAVCDWVGDPSQLAKDIVSILLIEEHILLVFKAWILCFTWAIYFVNKQEYVYFDEFTCVEKSVKQYVKIWCWEMNDYENKWLLVFMNMYDIAYGWLNEISSNVQMKMN